MLHLTVGAGINGDDSNVGILLAKCRALAKYVRKSSKVKELMKTWANDTGVSGTCRLHCDKPIHCLLGLQVCSLSHPTGAKEAVEKIVKPQKDVCTR